MTTNHKKIILASSSKSRRTIFKNAGLFFVSKKPNIDEKKYKRIFKKKGYGIVRSTKQLAMLKCYDVAKKNKKHMVVGSDTMIKIKNKHIHKAKNTKEAKKILGRLSGKKHSIYTSVFLLKGNKKLWDHTEKTSVHIRKLNKNEISFYVKKNKKTILETAGCYQAEKTGIYIFSKIEGDFYNVLGFPILQFLKFIRKQKPTIYK